MMQSMPKRKETKKTKFQSLSESYIIKSDGAVTLDLSKAAKSEAFREGIRRIRQHNLTLITDADK